MLAGMISALLAIAVCLELGCAPQPSAPLPMPIGGQVATGIGVVVGLQGTGDGDDFLPYATIYPQGDRRTMALVVLSAEVPDGADIGQAVQVHLSALGPATSLQGGRLLPATLSHAVTAPRWVVESSGPLALDGANTLTGHLQGRVRSACGANGGAAR